jgi:hypothetical protein
MPQQILSDYLAEIARIRATRAGTGEMSYYGALTGALNAAGERLKPRVFCVPNLRNRGSGFPDMGLFVAARGMPLEDWPEARAPERGVVEVDDIPADLSVKSDSAQVRRYLAAYGLVLVTNYRDFVLLGRDARGQPERREIFGRCLPPESGKICTLFHTGGRICERTAASRTPVLPTPADWPSHPTARQV